MRFSLLPALICCATTCAFAQAPSIVTLRPGDSFEIHLGGVPPELALDFNITYTVSQEGTVNIPLIGKTPAAGLSPQQLETAIQTRLVAEKLFTRPSININSSPNSRFVSIGGGVRAPQRLAWSADLTLRSAIDLAGGTSDFGTLKGLKLIRDGKVTVFDGRRFENDPSQDPRLLPGDQIIVKQ